MARGNHVPEVLLSGSLAALLSPVIPAEVHQFATQKGVGDYLSPMIALAQQAFPSATLQVSLGRDAEDETYQYIALDIEAGTQSADALLAGQRTWSAGVPRVCPSRHAVYFVLAWR